MNYLIFDLEWNQCPTGKEHEEKLLPFEILEIGAVKLNSDGQEIGRFSEKIRPNVYKAFHFHIQEVIPMDMESLKHARSFPDVFQDFAAWCKEDAFFCTWGNLDLYELQRNLSYYGLKNPFPAPLKYYNIQKIFSIAYEDGQSRRSLEAAADLLQLPKDMPFHSALNDALYTARILTTIPKELLARNYSFDYFQHPKNRKYEVFEVFDTHSLFISKEFDSKLQALRDWKVSSTKCYLCQESAPRKISWFSNGNNNYLSLSYCSKHGWLKGKVHMRKTADEKYFCIKTLTLISEEEAAKIRERKAYLTQKKQLQKK